MSIFSTRSSMASTPGQSTKGKMEQGHSSSKSPTGSSRQAPQSSQTPQTSQTPLPSQTPQSPEQSPQEGEAL